MKLSTRIEQSKKAAQDIADILKGMTSKSSPRDVLAIKCFAIAMEHHVAVIALLDFQHPLPTSACALLRPAFEAWVRGMWIAYCATDSELDKFLRNDALPVKFRAMLEAVELALELPHTPLTGFSSAYLSEFHSFVHTGVQQFDRWIRDGIVEDSFTEGDQLQALQHAGYFAFSAAMHAANVAGDFKREGQLSTLRAVFLMAPHVKSTSQERS